MQVSIKRAITPRAVELWGRKIGFGNRVEIQALQWGANYPLKALDTFIPGKNHHIERAINWVGKRIENLQEDPYRFSPEMQKAISKRKNYINTLLSIGTIIPAGLQTATLWLHAIDFAIGDLLLYGGWAGVALIIGHFGRNYAICKMIEGYSATLEAELGQRVAEQRYYGLFDQAPIGIISVNKQGEIFEINQAGLNVLGSPSKEATRRINMLTFPLLQQAGISENFRQILAGEKGRVEFETSYKSHWGKDVFLRAIIEGRAGDAVGIFEDISARRQMAEVLLTSQVKYRDLFENAPVGFHNISPEGIILDVNNEWLKVLGYSKEEVIERSIFDFVVPEQRENAQLRFKARLEGKPLPPQEGERQYLCKDGSRIYVITHNTVVRENNGDGIFVQTSLEDLTARRLREQAQREKANLQEAVLTLVGYTDYISQLLTGVQGGASLVHEQLEMLKESVSRQEKDDLLRSLGFVTDSAGKAVATAELVREFTKPFSVVSFTATDIKLILKDLVAAHAKEGYKIDFNPGEEKLMLEANPFFIHQATGYFIKNAVNAVKRKKSPSVSVNVTKVENGIKVTILDNGLRDEALSVAVLKRPPFAHGITYLYEEYLGLSLGLKYIELHNGVCQIESDKKRGNEVVITLPLKRSVK